MFIYEELGGKLHLKRYCPTAHGWQQMTTLSISKTVWLKLDRSRLCHCLRRWHQDSPLGRSSASITERMLSPAGAVV